MPKVSIVIPFHWVGGWQKHLTRCLESIERQSFKDYEVILVKHSSMPTTTNRAIESATGEIIKVLFMDDYLAHENSLQEMVDIFTGEWLVSGCVHDNGDSNLINYHEPRYTHDIHTGNNCIGSPSVLAFKKQSGLLFDENLSFFLDCDLYKRLYEKYGPPTILNTPNIAIGLHPNQVSNTMHEQDKLKEFNYMHEKYE